MRKLIGVTFILFMLILQLCASPALADEASGTIYEELYGNNKLTLDSTGVLYISGVGEMASFSLPWNIVKMIEKIIIEEGITSISDSAFEGFTNVSAVIIADTVKSIGNSAFALCKKLSKIEIPKNVSTIGGGAF